MAIVGKSPSGRRLRDDRPLLHEEGACLPLRSRHGRCRSCESACPVGALRVDIEGVTLGDDCMACGRCTAVCPTQALALPELTQLAAPVELQHAARTVRVECRMVPRDLLAADTLVLPCVGALTSGHLMARAAVGVRVQVVDRGWCAGCGAGGPGCEAQHPAQVAIDTARAWLEALASPALPERIVDPLSGALMPSALPPAEDVGPKLDRRSFFRDAIQRPAGRTQPSATPMGGDGRAAYPADRRAPSPERERQLAAAAALAERHQAAIPAEFYPRMSVDKHCCDQRLCVALCPTGALAAADSQGAAQLGWSAERCIACGSCERACPSGALHLEPHGGRPGTQVLATHLRLRCTSCGEAFTPDAQPQGPALCPPCAKSQRFMQDARRQLFGALN